MDLKIIFTFFYVKENNSLKINNKEIFSKRNYLKNKNIDKILYSQKKATENVFIKKNLPFRSFEIKKRDEKTRRIILFFYLRNYFDWKSFKVEPI